MHFLKNCVHFILFFCLAVKLNRYFLLLHDIYLRLMKFEFRRLDWNSRCFHTKSYFQLLLRQFFQIWGINSISFLLLIDIFLCFKSLRPLRMERKSWTRNWKPGTYCSILIILRFFIMCSKLVCWVLLNFKRFFPFLNLICKLITMPMLLYRYTKSMCLKNNLFS